MGVVGGVGGEKLCIGTGGKPDVCIMARNLYNVIGAGAFGGLGEGKVEVRRVLKWGGDGGGGGWRKRGEEGGGRGKDAAKPWDKIHSPPPRPASPPPPPSLTLSTCRLSPWGQERSRTLSSLLPLLHSIPTPYAARHAGSTFPP